MNSLPSKTEIRAKITAALKNIPAEKRESDSSRLCAKLEAQPFFQNSNLTLFFAPLPDEANIWPLLEIAMAKNKVIALPCYDAAAQIYKARHVKNARVEIISGQFGIREPAVGCIEIPLNDLDLVLVPGIAFDLHGNRLGRGRGFYDRLLEDFRGVKCGIAFDEQIMETIPSGEDDVRMNFILTPTRCLKV